MKATSESKRTTTAAQARKASQRLLAVGAAMLSAVTAWALIEMIAGVDLRAPAFDDAEVGQNIGLGTVIFTSLIASVAAWGLLALLERFVTRFRRIWTLLVVTGLVLSLGGPMSGTGVDTGNRVLLVLLHVIVAAVVIPLLYRTTDTQGWKE